MKQDIAQRIDKLAATGKPFLFAINYQGDKAYIKRLEEIEADECLYDIGGRTNHAHEEDTTTRQPVLWEATPPDYGSYRRAFEMVRSSIMAGNSYLTNLTCQVPVRCNLSLREIHARTEAKYRMLLDDKQGGMGTWACFSPETFVQIKGGRIYCYPMKGTADATMPNAERQLMEDPKEAAEHATIVDLIRNDLSQVATDVRVERYRYVERLHTNQGELLQTSSEISGKLPDDYHTHMGSLLGALLPAGSITGAPKDSTMRIIEEAEGYDRGFYTGIMGICEDGQLDSAVMIRFVEQRADGLVFKAGGGITSRSMCSREYEEVLQKVYLPITGMQP